MRILFMSFVLVSLTLPLVPEHRLTAQQSNRGIGVKAVGTAKLGRRVALVIGNGSYAAAVGFLKNPPNDSFDMATALIKLDFEVIHEQNLELAGMRRRLDEFISKLSSGDVGLFFFAGHGVQVDGINYLIPIGVNIRTKADFESQALSADEVLSKMEAKDTRINLLILDACRDNPFAKQALSPGATQTRSPGTKQTRPPERRLVQKSGLAKKPKPKKDGTLIAYATSPDEVAYDNKGERNSLYTGAILKHIHTPGLKIKEFFDHVAMDVKNKAKERGNEQVPWENSSLRECFSFDPALSDCHIFSERDLVEIPGGSFWMGSPDAETDRDPDEGPRQRVTVASFKIGKYEVTQAQYRAVMGDNHSKFRGDNLPVENVSWNDAKEFCQRLSQMTGKTYRLPTEAEWEYACRANTTTPFAFGSSLSSAQANFDGNYPYGNARPGVYRQRTTRVGSFSPNAFGIYDMHGNVWEWCEDVYNDSYNGAPADGSAWLSGEDLTRHVLRGGYWGSKSRNCRSADRLDNGAAGDPDFYYVGFRVVLVTRN